MKIKIWMCCMLQNSFHTSIYNKSRLEEKNLIEKIKMIQTYQWSICSSNSIEANPSFRVKVCILHSRTVNALVVKALEGELGLFNIFFIEVGNRNFPFLNFLEAVKAVKGMRCVHCFVFHPSTSAYCRSILVIEVLGDAMVGWLFSLGGCCCCCSLLFFAVCFPWAVVVVVVVFLGRWIEFQEFAKPGSA